MNGFRLVGFALAFTLPLCAQEIKLSEHQLGAYKGSDDEVRSVMSYCELSMTPCRNCSRVYSRT